MPVFHSSAPSALLAKLLTVDGAGSGLDADLLDATSSAGFQTADADLTTIAGLTATTDNFMQAKSSAWASRTIAQVKTDLVIPGRLLLCGNTGTITTGTPTYMTGGSVTAGVGIIPVTGGALHIKRMAINFFAAAATTSGSVTVRFTLFKNANSGTTNRILQVSQTSVTASTGYLIATSTIVDATMDAINGTTDYLVLAAEVTASTSCSLTFPNVLIEWTYD